MSRLQRGVLTLGLLAVLWLCPVPAGLGAGAWHLFAIFAAVIVGFILQPMPLGAGVSRVLCKSIQ